MTVLAWDGTTLAADKRALSSGLSRRVTKIFKVDDALVGIAGTRCIGLEMLEWYKRGL